MEHDPLGQEKRLIDIQAGSVNQPRRPEGRRDNRR